MNREDYQKVKQIFQSAIEIKPEERTDFIERACAGDDSLRRNVQILLHSFQSEFLEESAISKIAEQIANSQISIGQPLGRYKIQDLIGVGGMGEVFFAEDISLNRKAAIKVLPSRVANDNERIRRFVREARAASALNHPNILTIYEIGEEEGLHFIASEFVKGETLRDLLKREELTLRKTLQITLQIASALQAAHETGIIHRDIKPENIMIRSDGLVKVLDFGLAKLIEKNPESTKEKTDAYLSTQTVPGMIMGTTAYMSPEQARGLRVDARTDIWSLGVCLYEMVSGRLPFEGETTSDLIAAILKTEATPVTDIIKDIPPELESIIRKTLEKDLNLRYQTPEDLHTDLKRLKKQLEIETEIELSAPSGRERENKNTNQNGQETELIRNRPTNSKEYYAGKIKQHKVGFSVLLGVLILSLGTGIGFSELLSKHKRIDTSPLVAWYQAEGDSKDSIGGNDAKLFNITFTSGHSGQAFRFGSGYIDVPDSPSLKLQRLSVSVWVRSLSPRSPGLYNYLLSMGSSNCNGYGAYQLQTDNKGGLRFGVGTFGGAQSPDAGTAIWDGNWHFVVGTFDGSFVRLFVDGREVETGTPLPNHQINYNTLVTNSLILGDIQTPCFWGDSYKFHGDMDDLKIYNRALSKEEIQGVFIALTNSGI